MKQSTRPTRFYSKKQENAIAKAIDGKRQVNSGATAFQKGDVIAGDWLIEAKTCIKEQKSFTIHKEWLDKNKEECFAMNKNYSAVAFNFGDANNYYIIDERLFKRVKQLLEKDDNL